MAYKQLNNLWVAANIIFNLGTGNADQVLMLVNREADATIFTTEKDADTYFNFVQARAPHIRWFLDAPTPQRPQGYIIRGVQVTSGG